ncbi:MAG: aminopeptidase [Spirochaetes bacterium]|nr:aminopeptidase [Spirochaetota bacterium]
MKPTALKKAAQTAVVDCLKLQSGERFLVVSNPGTEQELIARALVDAAADVGAVPSLLVQPVKGQGDYAEEYVLEALALRPEAFASLSKEKLGKDRHRLTVPLKAPDGKSYDHIFHYLLHGTRVLRAFWSPGVSVEMFARIVPVDYSWMRSAAAALKAAMDEAVAFQVQAPAGTDIVVGALGRKAMVDDGDFRSQGLGGNLPAGEVFISPSLKTAEGRIVFDGSVADIVGDIVIEKPIECTVSGGFVLGIEGGAEAERLETALRKGMDMAGALAKRGMEPEEALRYATNARHLGELGIGLNRAARISGRMLENEKVYGTCHFALGSNYDEDAPAMIHLDGLVRKPTITALMPDGREVLLMKGGTLVSPGY